MKKKEKLKEVISPLTLNSNYSFGIGSIQVNPIRPGEGINPVNQTSKTYAGERKEYVFGSSYNQWTHVGDGDWQSTPIYTSDPLSVHSILMPMGGW